MVRESADTIYLVLPSASPIVGEDGELSDQDLEAVAGGGGLLGRSPIKMLTSSVLPLQLGSWGCLLPPRL